jgi:prevent-host-death family protein
MKQFMEKISLKKAREQMAEIVNKVAYGNKHYTLTKHGKGIAVIISLDEWKAVERLLELFEDEEDIRDADAAFERIKRGEPTISHEKMKKELGL